MAQDGYWNHNVHYQPVILGAVPPRCGPALDVGCGDGLLACKLAERCTQVTGIDRDVRMIAVARERKQAQAHEGHITFVAADFLAYPLAEASFDFVCANTSLHHMDFAAALTAMAKVLRPGGNLAIIGLAKTGHSPTSCRKCQPRPSTSSTGPSTTRAIQAPRSRTST
jgi:ubiquinone/menaquinone biosynthesis C-methylase UbiE